MCYDIAIMPTGHSFALKPEGKSGSIALEEAMAGELCRIFELFVSKQRCYGPGNIAIFGEKGVVVRSSDKLQRLINLVWEENPNAIQEETIDDTWADLATYCLIALLVRKNLWQEWVPSWKRGGTNGSEQAAKELSL